MTGIALAAAALAAVCVALAATLQHRAVRAVVGVGRAGTGRCSTPVGAVVTPRRLLVIASRPAWLAGLGFSVAGGVLHIAALGLAPLPVVQPVGALAVPVAVLLTAHATRCRPAPSALAGVVLSVGGVVAVVALSTGGPAPGPFPAGRLAWAVAAAVLVIGALAVAAARPGPARHLASAAGAAVAFGTEAVLLRALARIVAGQPAAPETVPLLLACAVAALVTGCWLVQQAYATGPAETVVAALTVLDPLVAVGLAAVVLGEGTHAHPVGLLGASTLATAGVLALARHHPGAGTRAPEPSGYRPGT